MEAANGANGVNGVNGSANKIVRVGTRKSRVTFSILDQIKPMT